MGQMPSPRLAVVASASLHHTIPSSIHITHVQPWCYTKEHVRLHASETLAIAALPNRVEETISSAPSL